MARCDEEPQKARVAGEREPSRKVEMIGHKVREWEFRMCRASQASGRPCCAVAFGFGLGIFPGMRWATEGW